MKIFGKKKVRSNKQIVDRLNQIIVKSFNKTNSRITRWYFKIMNKEN